MNSEELELSLRNEFESNLKNTLADLRQEMVQFQEKVQAGFDKHKSQLDEVFQEFSARIAEDKPLDESFTETVVEHLRLARDEGARITADAMERAEAMQAEAEPIVPRAGVSELRDAISDISSKTTQSAILKTLVHHSAQFTPRGAFFIIKNEHLVGWRVFGKEGNADEQSVREVFFPVASQTILGQAVRSLSAVESSFGSYADDSIYLNKFDFGHPERMFAVPLVVRGRSVAVLYADNGSDGEDVNVEALETLARVAGLTVEVLASARSAKSFTETPEKTYEVEESGSLDSSYVNFENRAEAQQIEPQVQQEAAGFVMTQPEAVQKEVSYEDSTVVESPVKPISETESSSFKITQNSFDSRRFEELQPEFSEGLAGAESEPEEISEPQAETEEVSWSAPIETEEVREDSQFYEPIADAPAFTEDFSTPAVNDYQTVTDYQTEPVKSFEPSVAEFEEAPTKPETAPFETTQFQYSEPATVETVAPNDFSNFETGNGKTESSFSDAVKTVSQSVAAATPSAKSRFSDRNVDLPIEVGEEERRLHNDARRFARLLVSEIKLYNEQKVKEGRDGSDLYERLREAIDRSREMYDKRVQPPVAARFDYFHYEVVNTLAEGDENKLGGSYPGATV